MDTDTSPTDPNADAEMPVEGDVPAEETETPVEGESSEEETAE